MENKQVLLIKFTMLKIPHQLPTLQTKFTYCNMLKNTHCNLYKDVFFIQYNLYSVVDKR